MSAIVNIQLVMEPIEGGAFEPTDSAEDLRQKIETEFFLIGANRETLFAQITNIEIEVDR